ncbi:gamma-tubulin complex component 4-like [Dendronephthya gigantea]|uniref:gamma-tubulin complex component 4-like n=1 Tax=Dendronephthya gigantea TaxID=151771 RepID=UPI00106963F2|nr:gamma-tubulin complex component 4-like [Dendronephthya gigantea]
MLHELLVALSGISGSIFVDKKEQGFQVVSDLPFLHPSETEVLNHLCKLGSYYQRFQTFIQCYSILLPGRDKDEAENSERVCGLYLQALCTGLDQVLEPYRKTLLALEQEILSDDNIPLTRLQHRLEEYQLLFPALANSLEEIEAKKSKGCAILNILHSQCSNGIPVVKDAFERMLHVCHAVMYKQLSGWLLHGLLLDYYNEFFIMVKSTVNGDAQTNAEKSDTENEKAMSEEKQAQEQKPAAQKIPENHFSLNAEMLPSYISTSVAEKILFVGESVKMLESALSKSADNRRDAVMKENELEFGRSLHKLQQEPIFHLPSFEKEIDRIKSRIAEHLWYLVVEEGELLKHLKLLKDFYLLGRGEIFRSLIDKSKDLLKVPPTENTGQNIKVIFDEIMRKLLPDEEENTAYFSLSVDVSKNKQKKEEGCLVTGWQSLKLHYDVQWPLHVVLTPTFLEKFNSLFRFLVNVRRTQMELQNVWTMFKGSRAAQKGISKDIWLLRMEMMFLVDNLQYYLQVDVLEAQYSNLLERINSTRDFETLRLAHDQFITTLHAQAFLLMRQVSHCLNEIMELCLSFCALLSHSQSILSERELAQVRSIKKSYSRQSSLLLKLFSGVRSHQASPHLAQFLLRIDFNKYFSTSQTGPQKS